MKRLFQAFALWYKDGENRWVFSYRDGVYAAILEIMDVLEIKVGLQCK